METNNAVVLMLSIPAWTERNQLFPFSRGFHGAPGRQLHNYRHCHLLQHWMHPNCSLGLKANVVCVFALKSYGSKHHVKVCNSADSNLILILIYLQLTSWNINLTYLFHIGDKVLPRAQDWTSRSGVPNWFAGFTCRGPETLVQSMLLCFHCLQFCKACLTCLSQYM